MTAISTTRAVERCERLVALGPVPAWWRVFALRRWLAAYDAVMALDISEQAEMLRSMYPAEDIATMATRANPTSALLRMAPRIERTPRKERHIEPVLLNQRSPR